MTQPPLSRQLKELEAELGKQLFIRGNRKITLTEDGMILRKRAEEIVALMEKTKAEINASAENITGDIYIGCAETEGMRMHAKIISKIRQEYDHIHFHISAARPKTFPNVWTADCLILACLSNRLTLRNTIL